MRFLAAMFTAFLAVAVAAAENITSVTIDGKPYQSITDAHVISGGKVVILYGSDGTTVPAEKLPKAFLKSWGITDEQIAASKAAAHRQAEELFAQAVRAGYFREVDGVVYDLRRAESGWTKFNEAKVLQVIDGGALVDPTPAAYQSSTPTAIFVRNLPRSYADNDKVVFVAKATGEFSYINKFGFQRTIHAYDVGRTCQRNEIPDAIVLGGKPFARVAFAARPRVDEFPRLDPEIPRRHSPGNGNELRAIGSGFFITADGYLLTNFHVVRDADHIRVKYKDHIYSATVVKFDHVNDVALVKVDGTGFSALRISTKPSAELGDAVFTIGFPNIDMQGLEPKYTDGKISSLAGMQDDPSEYQISVPVQPGNSGGPLCDADGQVVGIVVARLNDLAALTESGAVPQNVNYAVKVKYALRLIQKAGTVNGLVSPNSPKPAKPVHAVENAIGMVMIY